MVYVNKFNDMYYLFDVVTYWILMFRLVSDSLQFHTTSIFLGHRVNKTGSNWLIQSNRSETMHIFGLMSSVIYFLGLLKKLLNRLKSYLNQQKSAFLLSRKAWLSSFKKRHNYVVVRCFQQNWLQFGRHHYCTQRQVWI